MSNEMTIMENNGYMAAGIDLRDLFSEEMEGLRPSFDRIKIPAGGGISYEVPGDDPSNPDSVKEFKAVILFHHPMHFSIQYANRIHERALAYLEKSDAIPKTGDES